MNENLVQIEHYGQRNELRLAPDEGSGYVWRLVTFARFEERNGGLYLELKVVALSREFSGAARFLLQPLITRLPRQLLSAKLEQTRQAINSRANERLTQYEQTRETFSQTRPSPQARTRAALIFALRRLPSVAPRLIHSNLSELGLTKSACTED